ncbi:MAG: hypothetical protein U0414_31340 [Polyangiaceae bacterium]
MSRSIRRLATGGLCVGALLALGCGEELTDGSGTGGTSSSSSKSSTGASMSTSTGTTSASSSSGGIGPCVLDSSNLDACTLQ